MHSVFLSASTHHWDWCTSLKPINMWVYYISYAIIFGMGLPCLNNSLQSLYSMVLGKGRQVKLNIWLKIKATVGYKNCSGRSTFNFLFRGSCKVSIKRSDACREFWDQLLCRELIFLRFWNVIEKLAMTAKAVCHGISLNLHYSQNIILHVRSTSQLADRNCFNRRFPLDLDIHIQVGVGNDWLILEAWYHQTSVIPIHSIWLRKKLIKFEIVEYVSFYRRLVPACVIKKRTIELEDKGIENPGIVTDEVELAKKSSEHTIHKASMAEQPRSAASSRPASRAPSRAGSRIHSRAPSRAPSPTLSYALSRFEQEHQTSLWERLNHQVVITCNSTSIYVCCAALCNFF